MNKLTLALAALALLSACREKEYIPTDTFLDLELSAINSKNAPSKKAIVTVEQVILQRNLSDSIAYDSIPRSSKEVLLNLESSEKEWLGTCYIEQSGFVNHLELNVSSIALQTDSEFINYKVPTNWWTGIQNFNTNLNPANSDPILIQLDLTQSQVLDSNNQKWINPVFIK
ncbi:hypothetical protein Oweho_0075 [Owenweeksia hongkongensis DSM 17368]|uniref:Lipoprotein n=1 Tax=Owenweeksia hongkongensis (strain DSM 17368 / CIP 108786 / JCM 12287 / NRRL B-23963 / UST20020801) TaxID=926562 RepID=G8R5V1_OWEHD|nr:hypothetical protein [Owenweeksia hongkongensis]AEV31099.1 hypothetical protein Oweho_0075 [Owenweeksia hongkongensis DSM 17368]